MGVGVGDVAQAFKVLYASLLRPDFRKSLWLEALRERTMLPLIRCFLLGYFGRILIPEAPVMLPGSPSGRGRTDFLIGDVAAEFVLRTPRAARASLLAGTNVTEVRKLLTYGGHALLVLFDLSRQPLTNRDLERYRQRPSFGRGPHRTSAFNLAYYYVRSARPLTPGILRKKYSSVRVTLLHHEE